MEEGRSSGMDELYNSIEERVAAALLRNHLTIVTAESCTGGLIAATLINVSGISEVLKESYITYADETKQKILHVSKKTLEQYTAVSKETAQEMVVGVTDIADADVGISVTGIAGPDGGSEDFPVGLVYIGWKIKEDVTVERFVFDGDRMQVRMHAVETALTRLSELLYEEGYR